MTTRPDAQDWVRLPAAAEAGPGAARLVIAVLPAAAALVVLRRRARRRASQTAWRHRTHGEISAENQRVVVARGEPEAAEVPRSPAARSSG